MAVSLAGLIHPASPTRGFGVGLGVPIMQGILQKHGGEVTYESPEGGGAAVTLWLPLDIV